MKYRKKDQRKYHEDEISVSCHNYTGLWLQVTENRSIIIQKMPFSLKGLRQGIIQQKSLIFD
jgi:hypothetical protein